MRICPSAPKLFGESMVWVVFSTLLVCGTVFESTAALGFAAFRVHSLPLLPEPPVAASPEPDRAFEDSSFEGGVGGGVGGGNVRTGAFRRPCSQGSACMAKPPLHNTPLASMFCTQLSPYS